MIHIDLDAQQHKLGDHPAYTISMSALETYIRIFRREVSDKEIHVSSVKYFGQRMVGQNATLSVKIIHPNT